MSDVLGYDVDSQPLRAGDEVLIVSSVSEKYNHLIGQIVKILRGTSSSDYFVIDAESRDPVGLTMCAYGNEVRRLDRFQPEVTDAEEEEWQRMEWSKQITDTDDEAQALEDMVNHPPHYQSDNGIECIDAIRAALGLDGFVAHCRGTAIKYCWRSGKKQAHAEDLRKAAWYLNEAADALEE